MLKKILSAALFSLLAIVSTAKAQKTVAREENGKTKTTEKPEITVQQVGPEQKANVKQIPKAKNQPKPVAIKPKVNIKPVKITKPKIKRP